MSFVGARMAHSSSKAEKPTLALWPRWAFRFRGLFESYADGTASRIGFGVAACLIRMP